MPLPFNVVVQTSKAELQKYVSDAVQNVVNNHGDNTTPVIIGVSGGSIVECVAEALRTRATPNVKVFAVDERLVPVHHNESNTGAYLKLLPDIFQSQFAMLPSDLSNASAVAEYYANILRTWNVSINENGYPVFDLLFLGMGPDGHTCSLFPNHELSKYTGKSWILAIENSPKPPPRRITVSIPVLLASKQNILITSGIAKASVIDKLFNKNDGSYPTSHLVAVPNTTWILDRAAAAGFDS